MYYAIAICTLAGIALGYGLADLHWQSFFSRLLHAPYVYRIAIVTDGATGYEVGLHHGKKSQSVKRFSCRTVREALVHHLHDSNREES
jgi:hypothetical protein